MSKRGELNPVFGITDGELRTFIKSDFRMLWRNTSRKMFIRSVRVRRIYPETGNMCWHVQCVDCKLWMRETDKMRRTKKDGTLEKKPRSLYEVDHVDGITPLTDIRETIGHYWHGLMYGKMEVVCVRCHKIRTAKQTAERNNRGAS